MHATSHRTRLYEAQQHFNAGNLDAYLALYDERVVFHDLGLEPGLAAVRAFYRGFLSAFPDAHVEIEEVIEAGDRVAERFTLRATHRGVFQGIPPTGRSVTLRGITILHFEGGRCVERWTQADFPGLMQQLGTLPEPHQAGA